MPGGESPQTPPAWGEDGVGAEAEDAEEQKRKGEQEKTADLAAALDLPVYRVGETVGSWSSE